jgi:hypothetical protein
MVKEVETLQYLQEVNEKEDGRMGERDHSVLN